MSFPGDPWVDVPLGCAEDIDGDVDQALMAAVATDVLYVLSGRQFGIRTQTLRPRVMGSSCSVRASKFPEWSACGGSSPSLDTLPGPIVAVTEIRVRGEVLDPAAYRVTPARVTRIDGRSFPCCQPDHQEPPGLTVTLSWGRAVPDSGALAAKELACQLALGAATATAGKCKLPARVQTVTRQGVTLAMLDPQEFLSDGRTGLYWPDVFLGTFNPGKRRRRARVFSPDVPYTIT